MVGPAFGTMGATLSTLTSSQPYPLSSTEALKTSTRSCFSSVAEAELAHVTLPTHEEHAMPSMAKTAVNGPVSSTPLSGMTLSHGWTTVSVMDDSLGVTVPEGPTGMSVVFWMSDCIVLHDSGVYGLTIWG